MPRAAKAARKLLPWAGLLLALAWFCAGINWGLPSRGADAYLFGQGREPWTGKQILALAGGGAIDPNRGADVDLNPVVNRDQPVVLNDTDAKRAEIVRRYRLYSHQPDEMITFNALRQMDPGARRLDPKLYQYGGLWVYPVGALLKLASLAGLVDVRADLAFYLDNPQAFGRFYVVARLYSALWGVVGVWVVYRIVRKIVGGMEMSAVAPLAAAVLFATMPVVVNGAHEAKPHLAGTVLILLAVLAASDYVTTGRRRSWVAAGALCGAAFGMVLSALPVFVILPLMVLLRRGTAKRDRVVVAVTSVVIGIDVYFITNPYVLIHLVRGGEALKSNLGNSAAMYSAGGSAGTLVDAVLLIGEGTSYLLALAGAVAAAALAARAVRVRKDQSGAEVARRAAGLLLAAPALLTLVQFVALGAGKPGEYARFGILPDTFLAIEAVVAVVTFFRGARTRKIALGVLVGSTGLFGGTYLLRFLGDSVGPATRTRAAAEFAQLLPGKAIAVEAEPAPYSLPPVNLFDRRVVLVPRPFDAKPGAFTVATLLVRPVDAPCRNWLDEGWWLAPRERSWWDAGFPTRMSWAGKNFEAVEVGSDASGPTP
jgi:hypothetical protein